MPKSKRKQKPKRGAASRTGKPSAIRITIRVDADEAACIRRDAARKGMDVSELIRHRVL